MAGNKKQGKERKSASFFSIFNIFKKKRSRDRDDEWDDAVNVRRVCPSDEDKVRWVAEPGVDKKASVYIAKFYETRASDSEWQTVSAGNF